MELARRTRKTKSSLTTAYAGWLLSSTTGPMIEWYDMTADLPSGAPLFPSDMRLENGRLYPGTAPGFGVAINWDIVEMNLDRRITVHA
jgi:L-alanine-DL-glutamate epimerase-like enolase superfamily enzyme